MNLDIQGFMMDFESLHWITVGKDISLGSEGFCAAINADLRHVTLFGHNCQTAEPNGMPKVNSESRQPEISYDIKSTQFGHV